MTSSCRCCRWSGSWKRHWRASLNWRSGWPCSSGRPKTPDNSSLPPSKGQKPDRPTGDKPPRKSRPGVGRALEPNPDRIVDARLDACPNCAAAFPAEQQTPQQVYDRIELPPIKPDVTQVRLFGGRCACCGERATAAAPSRAGAGLAVRPVDRRPGGVSALRPRHRHGTAGRADGRDVRADDQRRCDQQHAGPCA